MAFEHDLINEEKSNFDNKQHLITDEKFQLIKQLQQQIFEITEVSPALRKIINDLITVENLEKFKAKFIALLNN